MLVSVWIERQGEEKGTIRVGVSGGPRCISSVYGIMVAMRVCMRTYGGAPVTLCDERADEMWRVIQRSGASSAQLRGAWETRR